MNGTESVDVDCPYCGEPIEVVVDCSVDYQEYIEDCAVCCRPITFVLTVDEAGDVSVIPRHVNSDCTPHNVRHTPLCHASVIGIRDTARRSALRGPCRSTHQGDNRAKNNHQCVWRRFAGGWHAGYGRNRRCKAPRHAARQRLDYDRAVCRTERGSRERTARGG